MARQTKILDQYGEPVQRRMLTREIAAPELTGVRTLWHEAVAPGLTPQRLAAILRSAEDGNHRDFLSLAEEMEERELHYASVLATRKRALSSVEPVVEPASEDARDIEIADAVQDLVKQPVFKMMVEHLADALGKSYAVSEIMWDTSTKQWMPYDYRDRDPRFFTFEMVDRHVMKLASLTDPINGDPMPPFKFIRHVPKLKSGIPIRGGLARPATWAFIFKAYTLKDWVAFCEVYGMPIRIGKYGPQATTEDKAHLLNAVRNIGSDAAGIVPASMAIEFIETGKGAASEKVFSGLADYLDKQVSKLVLGQTMTTDHGSSMAQAKVHEEVRHDIKIDDCGKLEVTINRDLVRAFVDLNYGQQKKYPSVKFPVPKAEDLKVLSSTLTALVPLGLRVSEADVRERLGFAEPDDDEPVLAAQGPEQVDVDPDTGDVEVEETVDPADKPKKKPKRAGNRAKRKPAKKAANRKAKGKKGKVCASCGVAHNTVEQDDLDDVSAHALEDWERVADPLLKPIRDLVNSVGTYDELIAGLAKVVNKVDGSRMVETLAASMAIARGLGGAKP